MLLIRKSWSHSGSTSATMCARTVLAGMKRERANPREIEGKQALFVVNLAPRKMAGMVSEAMLFDIGYADGITPVLAVPESRVPDGTRAGWIHRAKEPAGSPRLPSPAAHV